MKAIRVKEFGPPDVMKLEEMPDFRPGAGQVVVRIKAAGVNPVDSYVRTGAYSRRPALPYTPGSDGAGVVETVAPDISGIMVGARVYLSGSLTGTYAEQALCDESQVHHLPDELTFAQGAAVNIPYATAYRALFQRAQARPGEFVLIHGATGGVGIAGVQFSRAAGLTVIATGGTEKGRTLLNRQGAHFVLDHTKPNHLDEIGKLTEGRGVDVIIEMLANVNLDRDLKTLAPGGRVVIVGSRGRVEIDPRDIMAHEAAVLGMLLFNAPENETASLWAALAAGLENGMLRPVVGQEIPLAEAARAHREIMEPGAYGKIVLIP
jgi:NADPH2:quinone reductase